MNNHRHPLPFPEETAPPRWFHWLFINTVPALIWILSAVYFGFWGYSEMTKEDLPDIAIPQALIVTKWNGANASQVEKEITKPLEQELRGLKNLRRYRSSSTDSISFIAVEFTTNSPLVESMQTLRDCVAQAQGLFPKDVERSTIEQISVRDLPIATYALYGDLNECDINRTAKDIKRKLEQISGIKKVLISGNREQCVRIDLYPERLALHGISASKIKSIIHDHNQDFPLGQYNQSAEHRDLKLQGTFTNLTDIGDLPIQITQNGNSLPLHDVADISLQLSMEKMRTAVNYNGGEFHTAVVLSLYKMPGKDTCKLVDEVKTTFAAMQKQTDWPDKLQYLLLADDSAVIAEQLTKSLSSGWQAMLIVFIVLMFMLTWKEALIAACCIPLTILCAIGILWFLGYTFNQFVIIGIILALGLLVDDFILIMEGMHEYTYIHRQSFEQAAWNTLKHFAIPSLSGSCTTILVMLPIAAIGGIDGKFIRIIPITATICLILSYIFSIIISIPLSRILLKPGVQQSSSNSLGRIDRITQRLEKSLTEFLKKYILNSKVHAIKLIILSLTLFIAGIIILYSLPQILYPKEDGRTLGITLEMPTGTTLNEAEAVSERISCVLQKFPIFRSIVRVTGAQDSYSTATISEMLCENSSPNFIGFSCLMKPKHERDKLTYEYVPALRQEIQKILDTLPGTSLRITPEIGGSTADDPIQIEITGTNLLSLRNIAYSIEDLLHKIPGITDIRNSLGQIRTAGCYIPQRNNLLLHEISEREMVNQIRPFSGYNKVGKLHKDKLDHDLDIVLGSNWPGRKDAYAGPVSPEQLAFISIIRYDGEAIPLDALADFKIIESPKALIHYNGQPSVTLKAKVDGVTLNEVLQQLSPALDRMKLSWPTGTTYIFSGEAEQAQETYASVGRIFLLSLFLVYAILALLFNSLRQPALILLSVIFGLTGVFWGFRLLGLPLSFTAAIGIVSLIGINVNDAIVLVDTMNHYLQQGMPVYKAAALGTANRLRPIICTTVTTIAGLIPLAISDPGWKPLCLAIICGEIVSTSMCLIIIPCSYLLLTPEPHNNPKQT